MTIAGDLLPTLLPRIIEKSVTCSLARKHVFGFDPILEKARRPQEGARAKPRGARAAQPTLDASEDGETIFMGSSGGTVLSTQLRSVLRRWDVG